MCDGAWDMTRCGAVADIEHDSTTERGWADDLRKQIGSVPTPLEDLVRRMRENHPAVTPSEIEEALELWPGGHDSDHGWVNVFALADGAVLTHMLTDQELDSGRLLGDDDLALWARLALDGLPLAGAARSAPSGPNMAAPCRRHVSN